MSTIIMSQCWPLQMGRTEKAVLISLSDNANDQGVCWPAVDTIAMRCCLSDRAVQKAMDWLEEHSLIKRQRKTGRSTVYTVTPNLYQAPERYRTQPPKQVHPRTPFTPEQDSPPKAVHPTPEGGSPTPPNGVHQPPNAVHPNRKEPTAEPKGNRQGAPAKTGKAEKAPTLFERLWQAYPRKTAKADAEKAFTKLGADEAMLVLLLEAVVKQSAWPDWREVTFIPHLATWLNGKRWLDEPAPKQAAGASGSPAGGSDATWWETAPGIEAKGAEVWRARKSGEEFQRYKVGVFKAAGEGPWRQVMLADLLRTKSSIYADVHTYFYGHPPTEGQV